MLAFPVFCTAIILVYLNMKQNKSIFPASVKMAEDNSDFVLGFISRSKVSDCPQFVHMTPGGFYTCITDKITHSQIAIQWHLYFMVIPKCP